MENFYYLDYIPSSWPERMRGINKRAGKRVTSMQSIAQAAGLYPSGICNFIAGKQELGFYKAARFEAELLRLEELQGYDWRTDKALILKLRAIV